MPSNDSPYNDPTYNITSVPSWKSPPLHGAYAPNARLSPRAMAGIGVGVVVLAATGVFAWSDYASDAADAEVRKAQIALDAGRLQLERDKQQAEQAKAGGQETEAQRARRTAVEACVAKAGGAFNAVSDCGKAYPVVDSLGMVNAASSTAAAGDGEGSTPTAGLVVLGVVGVGIAYRWTKKQFARA